MYDSIQTVNPINIPADARRVHLFINFYLSETIYKYFPHRVWMNENVLLF